MNYNEAIERMNAGRKIPYPAVDTLNSEPYLLDKLFNIYIGTYGEFSSIGQYSFQSIAKFKKQQVHTIMERISMMEMTHLEKIGECITLLGELPKYLYKDKVWNGRDDVKYDLETGVKDDIILETNAVKMYEELKESTKNENLIKLIDRILLDENLHLEIFNSMLNNPDFYTA